MVNCINNMLATLKQYKSSNGILIVNQGSTDRIHSDFNPPKKRAMVI